MKTRTMERTAALSLFEEYRYRLTRAWGDWFFGDRRTINFVMLNPSTADAAKDDPTIRRCIRFADEWGYSRLIVTNLYAFRATRPADLWPTRSPVGQYNHEYLRDAALESEVVIAAWGSHGARNDRGREVAGFLMDHGVDLQCLGLTDRGEPRHPLYLPSACIPVPFRPTPARIP